MRRVDQASKTIWSRAGVTCGSNRGSKIIGSRTGAAGDFDRAGKIIVELVSLAVVTGLVK
jgi:hypothetical protein